MVNMEDVAQRAKVSTATVSRVFNKSGAVSEETRLRVISACEALNYKLNPRIQDLTLKSRRGSTKNLAFVLVNKDFSDPAYSYWVDVLSEQIYKRGYHMMLVKVRGDEANIYELPPELRDERIDGVLISGALTPEAVALMNSMSFPCVVIGNYSSHLLGTLSNVETCFEGSIFDAIKDIFSAGCRRIGFIEEKRSFYYVQQYFAAYQKALDLIGLPFDEGICWFGDENHVGITHVMKEVLGQDRLPFDALICPNRYLVEEITLLAMQRFDPGRKIDFLIASAESRIYPPSPIRLITLRNTTKAARRDHANSAVQLLLEHIEDKHKPPTRLTMLAPKEST